MLRTFLVVKGCCIYCLAGMFSSPAVKSAAKASVYLILTSSLVTDVRPLSS
jgi:hypothetical protein